MTLSNDLTDLKTNISKVAGMLATLAGKASEETIPYSVIRAVYRTSISGAMNEYMAPGAGVVTSYRNRFKRAMNEAFGAGFWRGYADAAGEPDYTDAEARRWLVARINQEIGNIDELFVRLREVRLALTKDEMTPEEVRAFIGARVDGYAGGLDGVYNAGAMYGKGAAMLMWHLGATEEHCKTCSRLDGKEHRARWYITRNYIPRRPGADMDCGGYQCECYFT